MAQQIPNPPNLDAEELCKIQIRLIIASRINHHPDTTLRTFLSDQFNLPRVSGKDFRWVHVPMNNMHWVEVCLTTTFGLSMEVEDQSDGPQQCVRKCNRAVLLQPSHWTMSVRPALSGTMKIPLHARHMELKYQNEDPDFGRDPKLGPLCTIYVSA
jgi:hypothetical protein